MFLMSGGACQYYHEDVWKLGDGRWFWKIKKMFVRCNFNWKTREKVVKVVEMRNSSECSCD